jgi:hypothetical protein
MNAKRKWDMRTILLVFIIAVIIIAVIYVIFFPPDGDNKNQTVLTVEELVQNSDKYVGKKITVEGFYHISIDGDPSLIPATTVSNPNPTILIILDENSLNEAKQVAGNITVSSNLKYRVVGVLQKSPPLPIGFNVKIIVESIEAV